jgi:hypothetical protein
MTIVELHPDRRRSAGPGPCLTARPAAGGLISALFALAVLMFLLGLLALV